MAPYMRERRQLRRAKLIKMAGGKCITCGGTDRLQFDHRDRTLKRFNLSGSNLDRSWYKILIEFAKCDLLCFPCHRKKTVAMKEDGGGWNKIDQHGTEAMYCKGCTCDPCRQARYNARVRRGEIAGTRGRYKS